MKIRRYSALALALTLSTGLSATPENTWAEDGMIQISAEGIAQVPAEVAGTDQDLTFQAVKIVHDATGEVIAVEPVSASGGDLTTTEKATEFTATLGVGYPVGAYGTLGVIIGNRTCTYIFIAGGCEMEGLLVEGGVAQNGAMLSVGLKNRIWFITWGGGALVSGALKMTAFRTNEQTGIGAGKIYLGPHADLSAYLVHLSIGFLAKVSGGPLDPGFLPTISFGLGF